MESLRFATGCLEDIPEELKPFSRLLVLHLRHKSIKDELSRLMLHFNTDTILSWISVLKLPDDEEIRILEHISRETRNMDFLDDYNAKFLIQYLPS